MSLSPTTGISRLSLECNSSIAQGPIRMQSLRPTPSAHESEYVSDTSDWEPENEDEETDTVCSPTGLRYNVSRLSPRTRQVVQGLFNQTTSSTDPPQISLELCGIREEGGESSGHFYAFQLHEVVPCSVRIGARDSGRFSDPKCECPDARYRHVRPCKHLIWLLDRISKHALFDHDPDSTLTLTEAGYAEELGDPFEQISRIRLDVLADDLRCDTSEPDSDTVSPNPARIREAREMVAAVAGVQPGELDNYRPDLEASYDRTTLIRRGDLSGTLFSLFLASHSLAEWVRSELRPSDPAVDPFRRLQQRAARIAAELDAYSAAVADQAVAETYQRRGKKAEGPRDANWAATQIQHCVTKIEKLVARGSRPLPQWARSSAARALVGILKAVVRHRDLYALLVGIQDTNFVYPVLDMLSDQSQFVEELEDIMDSVGTYGASPSYVANMRSLIARMRSSTTENVASEASGVPRVETPPLNDPPLPATQEPAPRSSSSVRFLTPELPASVMGRGSRGGGGLRGRGNGRGSKRSASRGNGRDGSSRGSKRARGA